MHSGWQRGDPRVDQVFAENIWSAWRGAETLLNYHDKQGKMSAKNITQKNRKNKWLQKTVEKNNYPEKQSFFFSKWMQYAFVTMQAQLSSCCTFFVFYVFNGPQQKGNTCWCSSFQCEFGVSLKTRLLKSVKYLLFLLWQRHKHVHFFIFCGHVLLSQRIYL